MRGRILTGSNNIYTVETEAGIALCRIKGKILRDGQDSYNPLAPGDFVSIDAASGEGRILSREERKNRFARWNKKKQAPQTVAANIDTVVCVTSVQTPPFRPRFVDRVLVTCEHEGIEPAIVVNKSDLAADSETADRIANYRDMGYIVFPCSALTGDGIDSLSVWLNGKTAVFIGQSGVGKSSVLNAIAPSLKRKTGMLSRKYDRGAHTTSISELIVIGGTGYIDTPGVREFDIFDIPSRELALYFRDMAAAGMECQLRNCLHVDEPGCRVRENALAGRINPDRYESYLRLLDDLVRSERNRYG